MQKDIRKRENLGRDIRFELLEELFKISKNNNLNIKTLRDIFISLYKDKFDDSKKLEKYLKDKNFLTKNLTDIEIEKKVKEIIEKNKTAPFPALNGFVYERILWAS